MKSLMYRVFPKNFADLWYTDRPLQNEAFHRVTKATEEPIN